MRSPGDRLDTDALRAIPQDGEALQPGRAHLLRILRLALTLFPEFFRLYMFIPLDGVPIIWGLAQANLGEREVFQALTLERHGGKTIAGVYARVAARVLAMTMASGVRHNWQIGVPSDDPSPPTTTKPTDSLV